jgi:hypothetical protein
MNKQKRGFWGNLGAWLLGKAVCPCCQEYGEYVTTEVLDRQQRVMSAIHPVSGRLAQMLHNVVIIRDYHHCQHCGNEWSVKRTTAAIA